MHNTGPCPVKWCNRLVKKDGCPDCLTRPPCIQWDGRQLSWQGMVHSHDCCAWLSWVRSRRVFMSRWNLPYGLMWVQKSGDNPRRSWRPILS